MRRSVLRRRNPFRPEVGRPLLVHCSHHKVGTVWFRQVLGALCDAYGLRLQRCLGEPVDARSDIAFFRSGRHFHPDVLGGRAFRGSHMIRDPRDVIVSGYFYHRWTDEEWAHEPDERFGGRSYQEYLNAVDRDEGLMAEIERCAGSTLADMAAWDYGQPGFLELRYEEVIADEPAAFGRLFAFYGLDTDGIATGLAAVERYSIRATPAEPASPAGPDGPGAGGRGRHVRSGRPGEWREHFGPDHVARFEALTGDLVVRLGYEPDEDGP
jgi:hypothetical protein